MSRAWISSYLSHFFTIPHLPLPLKLCQSHFAGRPLFHALESSLFGTSAVHLAPPHSKTSPKRLAPSGGSLWPKAHRKIPARPQGHWMTLSVSRAKCSLWTPARWPSWSLPWTLDCPCCKRLPSCRKVAVLGQRSQDYCGKLSIWDPKVLKHGEEFSRAGPWSLQKALNVTTFVEDLCIVEPPNGFQLQACDTMHSLPSIDSIVAHPKQKLHAPLSSF